MVEGINQTFFFTRRGALFFSFLIFKAIDQSKEEEGEGEENQDAEY